MCVEHNILPSAVFHAQEACLPYLVGIKIQFDNSILFFSRLRLVQNIEH